MGPGRETRIQFVLPVSQQVCRLGDKKRPLPKQPADLEDHKLRLMATEVQKTTYSLHCLIDFAGLRLVV